MGRGGIGHATTKSHAFSPRTAFLRAMYNSSSTVALFNHINFKTVLFITINLIITSWGELYNILSRPRPYQSYATERYRTGFCNIDRMMLMQSACFNFCRLRLCLMPGLKSVGGSCTLLIIKCLSSPYSLAQLNITFCCIAFHLYISCC